MLSALPSRVTRARASRGDSDSQAVDADALLCVTRCRAQGTRFTGVKDTVVSQASESGDSLCLACPVTGGTEGVMRRRTGSRAIVKADGVPLEQRFALQSVVSEASLPALREATLRERAVYVALDGTKREGTAEEVADAIMWLCSEQSSYVTGSIIPVAGGRC